MPFNNFTNSSVLQNQFSHLLFVFFHTRTWSAFVYTTGNVKFAECFYVCRVYSLGHSANKLFAECCAKNTQQKKHSVKRRFAECQKKKHSAKRGFAECFLFCTWQRNKIFFLGKKEKKKIKKKLCRVPRSRTLGK